MRSLLPRWTTLTVCNHQDVAEMTESDFWGLVIRDTAISILLSWSACAGGANCHVVRTLQWPSGESFCGEEQKPPADSHVRAACWNQILQPRSSLRMTAAQQGIVSRAAQTLPRS